MIIGPAVDFPSMSKTLKRTVFLVALLSAAIMHSGCGEQTSPNNFTASPFRDSPATVTLCFDLRNDEHPTAGLLLKVSQTTKPEPHTVALPFDSESVAVSRDLYSTWGSYDATTLITYYSSPNTGGTLALGIVPIFGPCPDQWADDPHDLVQSSLFLSKLNLTRHFIFKYPDLDRDRKQWLQDLSNVTNTNIDLVAVALPQDAIGKEIRRTGRTSIPNHQFENGTTKFYAAAGTGAQGADAIQIKYEIPPNKKQRFIVETIVKGVIAFLPPAVQLIVLRLRRPDQKARARRLILIVAGIQLLVLVVLIYMGVSVWEESIERALSDLLTALGAAVLTGYALLEEKKSS